MTSTTPGHGSCPSSMPWDLWDLRDLWQSWIENALGNRRSWKICHAKGKMWISKNSLEGQAHGDEENCCCSDSKQLTDGIGEFESLSPAVEQKGCCIVKWMMLTKAGKMLNVGYSSPCRVGETQVNSLCVSNGVISKFTPADGETCRILRDYMFVERHI